MRILGQLIEYDLDEAAILIGIPARQLKKGVQNGHFRYFYKTSGKYKFHDANILEIKRLRSIPTSRDRSDKIGRKSKRAK